MNGISVHCAISILRRFSSANYKRVVDVLARHGNGKLGSGWQRAIDHPQLFLSMYQFSDDPELTTNRDIELQVWKATFPRYPQLSNWETNIKIYEGVIKRELHIQRALDHACRFDVYNNGVYGAMRLFKNPALTISEVETFFLGAYEMRMDLPRLVDDLVEIRRWPSGLDEYVTKNDFWRCVFQRLASYKPNTERSIANLYAFIEKYTGQVDWQKDDIYKLIDYNFLEAHQDMWSFMNWQKIIQHIKLPEPILGTMMDRANTKQPFFGKYLNVAHIPTFQTLTEEFIEKWFVNGLYDQDHIWANIFRSQRHLSDEFRKKYEHKQPKGVTSKLQETIAGIQSREERRINDAPAVNFAQFAKTNGIK